MIDYAQSLFPDTRKVAGLTLQPLCLGHAFLLLRLGSPFGNPAPTQMQSAECGDMALALLVLSRPWNVAARLVNRWHCRFLLWYHARRFASPLVQAGALRGLIQHVADAWQPPKVWLKSTTGTPQRPEEFLSTLLQVLVARVGMREQDAFDLPLRRALLLSALRLQADGILELVTAEDNDLIAASRREAAPQPT